MKFDHRVKYGGVYYAAGEDVPMKEKVQESEQAGKQEQSVDEEKVQEPEQKAGKKTRK